MWARHRLEWVTAVVAAVLGGIYLALPRMGSDLAAQFARAGFFAEHGWTPIDLRWYGGVDQLGYSLVAQPVMALLGVRVTGVVALVAGSVLLAALFRRTGMARPWLGALVGVGCILGNLISGRVTYGIGVCLGLAALLALTFPRLRPFAAAAALATAATSPVAGLFLGLAGTALLLSGRIGDGLLVAVPVVPPLASTALLFGDGGWMNISHSDVVRAVLISLMVAAFVPFRPVRSGSVLSAAGVVGAALIHTPVGLNATRLPVMFAMPLLAAGLTVPRFRPRPATAPPRVPLPAAAPPRSPLPAGARGFRHWPLAAAAVAVIIACYIQPPVVTADLHDIGNPSADPAYFAPLVSHLTAVGLTGRVEIPATRDYWEAASMGDIPLARGWLRQADIDRNPLFFDKIPGAAGTGVPLNAGTYRSWLSAEAVQFVAVPGTTLTWSGLPEANLVVAGLPYLSLAWRNADWRLYAVADAQPIVTAPASLAGFTSASITIDAPGAGDIPVRIRYYRRLRASGSARVRADGVWTVLHVPAAGRYTLTS